jgi:hypothetical protein
MNNHIINSINIGNVLNKFGINLKEIGLIDNKKVEELRNKHGIIIEKYNYVPIYDKFYNVPFNKTDYTNNYYLIKYIKSSLNYSNYKTLGLLRSIIVFSNEKIVCFSPPKSLPFNKEDLLPYERSNQIRYQEYVKGKMVNLFYTMGKWVLATKDSIGSNNPKFVYPIHNNKKDFRRMFIECMIHSKLEFKDLNPTYCYSFMIQHPEDDSDNSMKIIKIIRPALILCAIYECSDGIINEIDITTQTQVISKITSYVSDYKNINSIDDALDVFCNIRKTPYYISGIVMKLSDGTRYKCKNPTYEYLNNVIDNNNKCQYQYLNLRSINKVKEYLSYYPEYKTEFNKYRKQVHIFTKNLHKFYIDCFVKGIYYIKPSNKIRKKIRNKNVNRYPEEYRKHLRELHNIYINECIENKTNISFNRVINYINSLHPNILLYCINYMHRKKQIVDKMIENYYLL